MFDISGELVVSQEEKYTGSTSIGVTLEQVTYIKKKNHDLLFKAFLTKIFKEEGKITREEWSEVMQSQKWILNPDKIRKQLGITRIEEDVDAEI